MGEPSVKIVDCDGLPGEFAAALRKRSRALKLSFRTVETELLSKDAFAGIRVDFLAWGQRRIRLELWDDRWVWLDMRKPAPRGWAWSWTREGWLADRRNAADLVEAVKSTPHPLDGEALNEIALEAVWSELIADQPD